MKFWGTAEVIKRNKRLHIHILETDAVLYTPPDFLREHMHSREPLQKLADIFTRKQERSIQDIMEFETSLRVVPSRKYNLK